MALILNGTTGISDVDGSASTPALTGTDTNTGIFFPAADTIAFSEGGVESMRIDSSGNVGIGTSSPTNKVQLGACSVLGQDINSLYIGANFKSNGQYINTNFASQMYFDQTDAKIVFRRAASGTAGNAISWSESMRIDSSGNVGIGTSSPITKLDVLSASGANTIYSRTTGTTSSDSAQMQCVNGSVVFQAYAYSSAAETSVGSASNHPLLFRTNSTERMRIDTSGYITSLPTYNNGSASGANMVVNSSGLFLRSVSALKYKQDVRDLESIDITKFRPVRYKSKCEGDDQEKDHFGVIADEVHEAGVIELVNYGAEGEVEGFQYERLTVVLLKQIQEQQAIITDLKARVEELEAQ